MQSDHARSLRVRDIWATLTDDQKDVCKLLVTHAYRHGYDQGYTTSQEDLFQLLDLSIKLDSE